MEWISTKIKLPKNGQVVLIFDGDIKIAKFERGISMEEREKMKRGEIENPTHIGWTLSDGFFEIKQSDSYGRADEHKNNKVPYCWVSTTSPMFWSGQRVSFWMPLPKYPERDEE